MFNGKLEIFTGLEGLRFAPALPKNKVMSIFVYILANVRDCLKKAIFVFTLAVFFSIAVSAQNNPIPTTETQTMPSDFKSDNCSLFPDCDYGDCCVSHDKAYYFGGSWKERWRADKKLYKCVAAKKGFHHKIIAPMMWLGIRAFGVSWLPTPFRWGFGKNKNTKKPKVTKNFQLNKSIRNL